MKLTDLVNMFMEARRADGRAERTLKDYRRVLGPFEEWCVKQGITSDMLNRDLVRQYVAGLRDVGWSVGTIGIHVRNLRSFLHWLYEEGQSAQNLAQAIKAPKLVERAEDLPTDEELFSLLSACDGDRQALRDQAIILALLDTGLRIGEFVQIQRESFHVDHEYGTAWIPIYAPKTNTHRFAFLGTAATRAVQVYLDERSDSLPALWVGCRGPLTKEGVYKVVRRRAAAAGLNPARVHPHAFRKLFATFWTKNGGDSVRLMRVGGWLTDAMLWRYVLLAKRKELAEAHRQYGPVDGMLK